MVNLSKEQKQYIQVKCNYPSEVIYAIEKRMKGIDDKMHIDKMIELAELYIEEQAFHAGDFEYERAE